MPKQIHPSVVAHKIAGGEAVYLLDVREPAKEVVAAETAKVAQNMGLPPGLMGGLPGFG